MKFQQRMKLIAALLLFPALTLATVEKLELEVNGLICAGCVEEMKKAIGEVKGCGKVNVDLETGKALVLPEKGKDFAVAEVIKQAETSGFAVKRARVVVEGNLTKKEGKWYLKSPAQTLGLVDAKKKPYAAKLKEGTRVRVEGLVVKLSKKGPWVMQVNRLVRLACTEETTKACPAEIED